MELGREDIAQKLAAYLRHEIALAQLVDWAERAVMEAALDPADAPMLAGVLARLGVADVRAFGLAWEDCENLLAQLGYEAKVQIVAR